MTNPLSQLDAAFQREARTGLAVLATLIGIFLVVAYGKYSGWFQPSPVVFSAVVDKETGKESLQPFSPFATVNTEANDFLPSAKKANQDNVDASENPADDNFASTQIVDKLLAPSTTGSASVPPPDLVGEPVSPNANANPELVTDVPPRPNNNIIGNQTGSFIPGAPRPKRLLHDEDAGFVVENYEGIDLTFPPTLQSSPTGIQSEPVRGDELSVAENGSAIPAADGLSNPPTRSPTLAELPSLRKTPIVDGNDSVEATGESVERVTFNEGAPVDADSQLTNRKISPETTHSEFHVARPVIESDEQATSIVSQDGDSFWLIAQRVYGDGRLFNALYEFNRNQVESFNEIPVGTRISTPRLSELRQKCPQLCPRDALFPPYLPGRGGIYTSIEGDTLFDIARDQLGQASRYLEIQQLNADKLPADVGHATSLPAGVQILLPVQR